MKVTVDSLPVNQIGQRWVHNIPRWYYTVEGYSNLLLVSAEKSLDQRQGQTAVALFNPESADARIICDVLPEAPRRWLDEKVIQVSVTQRLRRLPPGEAIPLSQAIEAFLSYYRQGTILD